MERFERLSLIWLTGIGLFATAIAGGAEGPTFDEAALRADIRHPCAGPLSYCFPPESSDSICFGWIDISL